jgi:hypothetical protein
VSRELEDPNVWNDPDYAQKLGKERASLEAIVATGLRDINFVFQRIETPPIIISGE